LDCIQERVGVVIDAHVIETQYTHAHRLNKAKSTNCVKQHAVQVEMKIQDHCRQIKQIRSDKVGNRNLDCIPICLRYQHQ